MFKIKGFTLVELVVSIGIVSLILAVVVPSISNSRNTRFLIQANQDILTALNKARSNAISSVGGDSHGVYIESNKVTVFEGSVYNQADSKNQVTNLDKSIEINSFSLNGGGSSIVFSKLSGSTNQYGTINLRVKSDTTKNKTITISRNGIINSN